MTPDAPSAHQALLSFLYQVPVGLLEVAADGAVTMANPMAAQLLLPLLREPVLDNLYDALHERLPALRAQAQALRPGDADAELALQLESDPEADGGARRVLELRLVRLDGARTMVSVSDVTAAQAQEQARLSARVHDAQRTDALTAMPNRQAVLDVLQQRLDGHGGPAGATDRLALLLVNLDRFERVNTRLGTEAGDDVLREVAARLSGALRAHDRVGTVARVGGDEFVVLLDGLRQPDDAARVAQRLQQTLAPPMLAGGQALHLAASIGVLTGPHLGPTAEGALHAAALAMREAKRLGGARQVEYGADTREQALAAARMEHELQQALASRQLFVVYQPIVPLSPDGVLGLEALVRWQHPERGLVGPDRFIPIAEASGLIVLLGAYVLEEACAQFVAWQQTLGPVAPAKLSVNVSRAQLQASGFDETVRDILVRTGMPPGALQIEVTESLAAQNEGIRATLQRFKAAGLAVALDDFGTGYSSLSSLHQLPVDVVKIDRSFVQLLPSSAHHRVLVQATLMVARSLGLATVAEGVETEEQADELRRLACGGAQGYLYARPLRAGDVPAWLHAHAAQARPTGQAALVRA
ncbi:MAG: bifunctional diguanylate cyclase/phosphodiesterase [Rubrivivax sp.]|nr:bifunctional diguanylate cyclase/phosphodiesterase [Rubrivivax sp.]